ncbi:MAG: S-layer homology domain-containing protein [Clostridia bacterium]|nr:S-layer homology domain-containing protein [Clostridia bacterium]
MHKSTKFNIRLFVAAVLTMVLLCATMLVGINAEEWVEYYYLNGDTGVDTNSGYTADEAVKTMTRVMNLAKGSRADKAIIVVTNAYKLGSGIKEVVHEIPFEITTNDGQVDYGKTEGAGLVFGTTKRYYFNGDTTFKNIDIKYDNSIVFVGQYHNVVFDEGITTGPVGEKNAGIYVLGGYQSPLDDCVNDLDSHITIKSGTFQFVIGGSRQKGTGAKGITFTGTHYIDISGGTIGKVYGGSVSNQISTAVNINITGGTIGEFYTGGEVTRRLEKDAVVNFVGGEIGSVNINNVVGSAQIYLLGTKIGSLTTSFASTEIATMERKANKDDVLYYDAAYYTKEQIESFGTGFEKVENVSKVFVKSNGNGDGSSETTPASFADGFATAAKNESVIVILDTVTVTDFVAPEHDSKVVIEGKTATTTLKLEGNVVLGGTVVLRDMRVSGAATIDASKGNFVVESTVGGTNSFKLIGSAELFAGEFASVSGAGKLYINGAKVGSITGGTEELNVEIANGSVGTIKTTDTSIKTVNISVSGGTVDKIIFNNVTEELSYLLYGGAVKAYEVAGNNVKGTLKMDTEKFTAESLGAAANLFEIDNTVVYFLKDGGTGNGTSATAAGNSLADAFATIGDNDGVVVVCGSYDIPVFSSTGSGFIVPDHKGEILITSVYEGVDYRKTEGACINILQNIYLGGDVVIDGVKLISKKSYGGILAAYHNLTIGYDVECAYGGSVTTYPCVVGGTYQVVENVSGNVTVNSGTWQRTRLGNSTGIPVNADLTMTINGGTFVEKVILGTTTSHTGDLTLVVNGGTFKAGIVGASMNGAYTYEGDMSIVINGGIIYGRILPTDLSTGTLNGTYNLTITGGNLSHVPDIKGTEGVNGNMTSTLYVGENFDMNKEFTGTQSFTSLVRKSPNGADPWLFYHDGFYYYIATAAGQGLQLVKAANLADIVDTPSVQIYKPAKGKEYSSHLWSPEIHYFSAEEIGEEYEGWYCFLGSQPDDAWHEVNGKVDDPAGFGEQRAFVIKCLTDDLTGPWGHPITGEPNVPQKIQFPDSDFNVNELTGGCSVITINGVKYITFISEVGRETSGTADYNFYQTINIAKFTNPWTIEGQPQVICKPEYDWEKGGSENGIHPQVVEGATAVYGPEGEVFIIYSGSGYWTAKYQLGQLKYIGGPNGDPTDIKCWEKKPESIFSQSSQLTGCGHASYVTDTDGQGWICYHAYPKGDGNRYAYIEPYFVENGNVIIGDRSGHPADVATVYTTKINPLPVAERISGFDKTETKKDVFSAARKYENNFTDVTDAHWFASYVKNAYELKLANGTSATKFSPDNTFTVAQALTAAANIHTVYYGTSVRAAAQGEAWYVPYVEYCVQNGIITDGQFADVNANITRGDMAAVFANILPDSEYGAVREGSNPDVTSDMSCYAGVLKLYRAGIVGGDSGTGNYRPNDFIKRSEACVIFTRIAMKGARAF